MKPRPVAVLAALLVLAVLPAAAQVWPSNLVKIVVPYPPGGGVDGIARPIAERLTRRWIQPVVVVENKAGAATIIGAESVAKAPSA